MRILIVDDELAPLELATAAAKGCLPNDEVSAFDDPQKALAFARSNPPDIALLDIRMRTMTGLDLARNLKGINTKVNVIFVTGYSEYAIEAFSVHASGYVTKPVTKRKLQAELDNLLYPPEQDQTGCRAQTFGNFSFFVDNKPVHFARSKSKEILALLIDRHGSEMTTEQMAAYIHEDRNYDRNVKNMMMTYIRCLQEDMKQAGAEDVIVRTHGHLSVDTTKFTCDAYDFDKGEPYAINAFKGEYMAQYSWAEERVGLFMY